MMHYLIIDTLNRILSRAKFDLHKNNCSTYDFVDIFELGHWIFNKSENAVNRQEKITMFLLSKMLRKPVQIIYERVCKCCVNETNN